MCSAHFIALILFALAAVGAALFVLKYVAHMPPYADWSDVAILSPLIAIAALKGAALFLLWLASLVDCCCCGRCSAALEFKKDVALGSSVV